MHVKLGTAVDDVRLKTASHSPKAAGSIASSLGSMVSPKDTSVPVWCFPDMLKSLQDLILTLLLYRKWSIHVLAD